MYLSMNRIFRPKSTALALLRNDYNYYPDLPYSTPSSIPFHSIRLLSRKLKVKRTREPYTN